MLTWQAVSEETKPTPPTPLPLSKMMAMACKKVMLDGNVAIAHSKLLQVTRGTKRGGQASGAEREISLLSGDLLFTCRCYFLGAPVWFASEANRQVEVGGRKRHLMV